METAWELAALVSLFPDIEPLVREDWDWSGRHIRLKYQMFVVTIFLFVISEYTLTDFKIPLANITTEEDVSQRLLFFVVLAFWAFSFLSFCSRTFREGKNIEEIKSRFNSVFNNAIDRNKSIEDKISEFDIVSNIEHLQSVLKSKADAMERLASEVHNITPQVKKLFSQVNSEEVKSNATGNFQNLSLFEKGVYSQTSGFYKRLQSGAEAKYKNSNSENDMQKVNALKDAVNSYDAELKNFMQENQKLIRATVSLGKIPADLRATRKYIKESLTNLHLLNKVLDKEVIATLATANDQLKAQNVELRNAYKLVNNMRGWIGFDRVVLSAFVPMLTCLVIAIVSITRMLGRWPTLI